MSPVEKPNAPASSASPSERVHAPGLVRGGRPPLESHRGDPERAVADELHDVDGEPGAAQPVQPGAEARPVPVELGRRGTRAHSRSEPAARRRRGRREAAHARHLGGDALPDLGLRRGAGEEREVRVGVHVDEAGRDHAPGGIDHVGGLARERRADGRDTVPGQRDVRRGGRGRRSRRRPSPRESAVEGHARLRPAACRARRAGPDCRSGLGLLDLDASSSCRPA